MGTEIDANEQAMLRTCSCQPSMSKEELKRFRQDCRTNPELKNRLKKARQAALRQASCAFANASGYSIVMDDFNKDKTKTKGSKKAKGGGKRKGKTGDASSSN